MTNKNALRLKELTNNLINNKNILEFLELYGILNTEARNYEALEGLNSIREYIIGFEEERNKFMEVENND